MKKLAAAFTYAAWGLLFTAMLTGQVVESTPVAVRLAGKAGISDFNNSSGQKISPTQTPHVTFSRKWNEDRALMRLSVENPEASDLTIEGVQTSANLFVVSFPATIRPGASANLVLRYVARPGASGDVDVVRLLTDQGEKVIQVVQDRESAFTLDSTSIGWAVGDKVAAKSVTLSVRQSGLTASAVRVLGGAANKAQLEDLGAGRYQISITPASTDEVRQFAVLVEMNPEVPGNIPVIQCSVAKAQ